MQSAQNVWTFPDSDTENVLVSFIFDYGSSDEPARQAGITHAVEHLVMQQIKDTVRNHGGITNAFVDENTTCYFITAHVDVLETILSSMEDILEGFQNFSQNIWQKEKSVIREELVSYTLKGNRVALENALRVSSPNTLGIRKTWNNWRPCHSFRSTVTCGEC